MALDMRPFPVGPNRDAQGRPVVTIPRWVLEPHVERIKKNHGTDLDGLAKKGGLTAAQIWCAVRDMPPEATEIIREQHAREWLDAYIAGSRARALAEARATLHGVIERLINAGASRQYEPLFEDALAALAVLDMGGDLPERSGNKQDKQTATAAR